MKEQIKDVILDLIQRRDWLTFPEIERELDSKGIHRKGNDCLSLPTDPNCHYWVGMSEAYADAIQDLTSQNQIYFHPSDSWTHFLEGVQLTLPVVTRPPRGGYKKPHWLPVCFRTVPLASE